MRFLDGCEYVMGKIRFTRLSCIWEKLCSPWLLLMLALLFALVSCTGANSATPLPTITSAPPLPTLTATPVPAFVSSATETVVISPNPTLPLVPSSIPYPTLTPGPTLTPFVLIGDSPTSEEIAELLFDHLYPDERNQLSLERWQRAAVSCFRVLVHTQVDIDGDGQPEILAHSESNSTWEPFFAILGRSDAVWEVWLYTTAQAHYCDDVRASVEADRVIVDFLTCGGGTGILLATLEQRWIQCEGSQCSVVWSATLASTFRGGNYWKVHRRYTVAEIEQPDAETIVLTTRRFGVIELPTDEYAHYESMETPPDTGRRLVGPDTVEVFRWDGSAYQQESRAQIAPELVIASESDLLTQETIELVDEILSEPFHQPSGSFDSEGYAPVWDDFWGLSPVDCDESSPWWESRYRPDAAAHNGTQKELGEWVAGVVGANDRPLCRLTVQRHIDGDFRLLGRLEVPCTANFTRLAWIDVTGDGNDELLFRTIPPNSNNPETGAGLQRLYIYGADKGLVEIAVIEGAVNGPDGIGVYWEEREEDDTVEIMAGLPIIDLEHRVVPDSLTRQFNIYRWDAAKHSFVSVGIRVLDSTE